MAGKNITLQSADGVDNLFPKAQLVGIDTSNILASGSGTTTYIASEDCMFVTYSATGDSSGGGTAINNIELIELSSINWGVKIIPLKKGQTIVVRNRGNITAKYVVYGLKH